MISLVTLHQFAERLRACRVLPYHDYTARGAYVVDVYQSLPAEVTLMAVGLGQEFEVLRLDVVFVVAPEADAIRRAFGMSEAEFVGIMYYRGFVQ